MRKLELIAMIPVYFNTDETAVKNSLDLDVDWDDYEIRETPFYDISALSSITHSDPSKPEKCSIHCGGEVFKSPLTVAEVRKLIEA